MPTLPSLDALKFVIMTNYGTTTDNKVAIMMHLNFQWYISMQTPCNLAENEMW